MWGYGYNMMGWGWLIGAALVAVAILVALVVALRVVPGRMSHLSSGSSAGHGTSSRRILDERYARGDLTTEEYLERAKHLGSA